MEKLIVTDVDKKYLKNLVEAVKHFSDREWGVIADSYDINPTTFHQKGYQGVSLLYYGGLANEFMKDNGIDPERIEKNEQGYQTFMLDGIEFRVCQKDGF